MNYEKESAIREIMQLAPRIEVSILSGLLLIRHGCARVVSAHAWPGNEQNAGWDLVKNAQSGMYIPAIIAALHLLMLPPSLVHCLEEAMNKEKPDEEDLREMIRALSDLVLDDAAAIRIYEDRLARETGEGFLSRGDFYTPAAIARLLLDLLEVKEGSVYDPCCGSGSILYQAGRAFAKLKLYGQTADTKSYQICEMISFLYRQTVDLGGRPANTLTEDLHVNQKFDYIATNIPFNLSHWRDKVTYTGDMEWQYGLPPASNANFAWVQSIVSHLAKAGRAVVILPNSVLTTQLQAERKIRQGLIEDGLIEAVITLPPRIFHNTSVPCCIWVFNKMRTSASTATTLLVDARGLQAGKDDTIAQEMTQLSSLVLWHRKGILQGKTGWYAVVSLQEISQKKYLLSPNFYTKARAVPVSPIRHMQTHFTALVEQLCLQLRESDLLPYIGQWKDRQAAVYWEKAALLDLYQSFGGLAKKKAFFGHGMQMVDVKTVIRHAFLPDSLSMTVEATEEEIAKYGVRAGDILLNRSSESVAQLACCCIVPKECCAVYGSYIKCLRPKRHGTPAPFYMAGYFRSAVYRHEVERVSPVYTTRANMNVDRLSEISVYYPDADTQEKLGATLFAIFEYQKECKDQVLCQSLNEFEKLLIEQFITYPILCFQKREDNKG